MKKILCLILSCVLATAMIGCDDEKKAKDELEASSASTQATEKGKVMFKENRERKGDAENANVFDETLILTDGEYEDLNDYAATLAQTYKINCAVVLTDDIGDSEPSDFAKNFYESNYSGDGILFLINNDTNNDYLYRQGAPSKVITDSDVQMLFAEISPLLALEDYISAAERVLEEAEILLPEYFNDKSGHLKGEEINALNDYIKDNSGDKNVNVYYVKGTGEEKIEDFAQTRFDKFYEEGADAVMIVIDGKNGNSYMCVSGSMTYLSDSHEDIQKAIRSCFDKKEGLDLEEAVKKFIGFVE